ncbi:MAG: ROK family transcriptional regulator [Trueperaceae bacterium]|nr:ROK family transcriptional regulator [Trueperaceae bacterium]
MRAPRSHYPGRPSKIRAYNRWRVMKAVRDRGALTRADLARLLHVSKVTASAVAAGLIENGQLIEAERAGSGVGRKPGVLRLSPTLGRVLAFDIDAHEVRATMSDLRGEALQGSATPPSAFATADDLEGLLGDLTRTIREAADRDDAPLRHVSIAVPASVDRDGRLTNAGVPRYLEGSRFGAALRERRPDVPVLLVNDMNAAALAERRHGAANDWNDFAHLGIRHSGIGMGLMLDGTVHRGRAGQAGEIGLLRLDRRFENLDAVFANDGKEALHELTTVLATTFTLLDLEGFVLHADVPRGRTWLAELEERLCEVAPYEVPLRSSRLGPFAPLHGGLAMALDAAWASIERDVTGVAPAAP